jgi:methionine-rich copper-binding protein CopC/putative copper export protein
VFRRLTAFVAVWGLVLAGPTLVGSAVQVVGAHAQLVTSTPGAGDVVVTSPTSLTLVFSETIDPNGTSVDLLDPTGLTLLSHKGAVDPGDPYTLSVPVTATLADGIYTVNWRSLSAADGHATSGFFTFGVGDVTPPPQAASADAGSVHAGHDAVTSFLETESRVLGDLGFLLAFGLPIIGWLVLRDRRDRVMCRAVVIAAMLGAIGSASLLLLSATSPGLDPVAFASSNRTGILLIARVVVALGGVAIAAILIRRDRQAPAQIVGAIVGGVGLVLLAAAGHAAAYADPGPVAAIVVHVFAVGIWLSGLLTLLWVAVLAPRPDEPLSAIVPRFSALALVAVALLALTGTYSDWVQTRAFPSIDTQYEATLLIKIAIALAAFAVGAVNFLDGGRGVIRLGGMRLRLVLEGTLAIGVLIVTGVLVSGSPPAQERPIAIAPAANAAPAVGPTPGFDLTPGRPGPTRFVVTSDAIPAGDTVELDLQRLDGSGDTRILLRAATADTYASDGGSLPANSRWDANVITRGSDGVETGRWRFSFALDATGISEGLAVPPVDPVVVIGITLLLLAILLGAFTIGGGTLPRVDRATGRVAGLIGPAVAAILGFLIFVGGLRP